MKENPLAGQTIRWSYRDGPVRGQAFEHRFLEDGSVEYRMVGKGKPTRVDSCEVTEIGDGVVGISYLGESGYTLTSILDYRNHEVVSFASNEDGVTLQRGTFELASAQSDEAESEAAPRTLRNDDRGEPRRASKPTSPHNGRSSHPSR